MTKVYLIELIRRLAMEYVPTETLEALLRDVQGDPGSIILFDEATRPGINFARLYSERLLKEPPAEEGESERREYWFLINDYKKVK